MDTTGTSSYFDAQRMLRESAARHGVRFDLLVAETAIWAAPEVHSALIANGSPAWFPKVRRGRAQTEKRGTNVDGVRFDDNSYANLAIKRAIGRLRQDFDGFETCHIWEKTCYDERYHTAIANLVLLPRALAGFSDHDPQISQALKYRAFELFGWYPSDHGQPERPADYPNKWRAPEAFSNTVVKALARRTGETAAEPSTRSERQAGFLAPASDGTMPSDEQTFVVRRVQLWARKPHQLSHIALAIVVHHEPLWMDRSTLVKRLAPFSKNPKGAIQSLCRSDGNSYGRALIQTPDGRLRIHPAVMDEILAHDWKIPKPGC